MKTLRLETNGPVLTVTIDRPDVRNAFNEDVIDELHETFSAIPPKVRAVVLTGGGTVFCAGADVQWMKKSLNCSPRRITPSMPPSMAAMFRAIDECPRPVIGRINGHALGGGSGLVACCDIVVAVEGALFGFTEVRLGIVPANISTFVLPKIGGRSARRYFLTGERFGALSTSIPRLSPRSYDGNRCSIVQLCLAPGPWVSCSCCPRPAPSWRVARESRAFIAVSSKWPR